MKRFFAKLLVLCVIVGFGAGILTGCGGKEETSSTQAQETLQTEAPEQKEEIITFALPDGPEEADVYIEPIPDISDDFIRGMDASSVLVNEKSGAVYYNYEGEVQDVFMTLAQSGVNYIRLRVWNDPYDENGNGYGGGNNDVATAIELGKRASQYGMKVCIDFHYSDFWADPKRQHAPKAWEGMSVDEKSSALYEFTKTSLSEILDAGVNVGMVQIGNEINNGMSGEMQTSAVMKLLDAGSRGVREISQQYEKEIQVAVHYTNIEEADKIDSIAGDLQNYDIDYDIFALSYYPFWDGTKENMQKVAENIQDKYGKKVMIAETSYCYTSEDGDGSKNSFDGIEDLVEGYAATVQSQASMIRDICAAANEAGVLGIFYWEGTWIPVGPADEDNSSLWEEFGSGWASSYAAAYDPEDAGLYYGGCSWDNQAMFDFEGHPLASLNVFKYLKYGATAPLAIDSIPEVHVSCDVGGEVKMINHVQNPSFEDADTSMWKVAYEGGSNPTDFQVKADDAYTGEVAFHFWSGDSDMDFSITQELTDLEPGTYQLSVYAQGGDLSENSEMELFAVTGGEEKTAPFMVTTWADWKNPSIPQIKVTDGTLMIGVRMKCNAGSWGTVDDFTLNRISD